MGLVSCGSVAFSQQKTEHGFYFPVDSKSSHQGLPENLREALAECTADSEGFHLGVDLLADAGTPIYAISGGIVTARSTQHLSPDFAALLVKHKPRSGAEFFAIYGNMRTTLEAGTSVTAGESIGVVGHSYRPSHLHFAVFASGGDASRALADWNLSQCSRWPDLVRYADPLQWLGPLQVAYSAPNRCDLNGDGVVDLKDVELGRQMALKLIPCTADLNMDGECNVIDVQRIVNASLNGVCRVGR
jgi:murein DD-endopeptidase MepM/ murein hydrolase activator NlpD